MVKPGPHDSLFCTPLLCHPPKFQPTVHRIMATIAGCCNSCNLAHLPLQLTLQSSDHHSIFFQPTYFKKLNLQRMSPTHTVSLIYFILSSLIQPNLPPYTTVWEKKLLTTISPAEWECFILTHKLSVPQRSKKKEFKFITRWYLKPGGSQAYISIIP